MNGLPDRPRGQLAAAGLLVVTASLAWLAILSPVLDWHAEIDAYLAAEGVPFALLRPATFTDTTIQILINGASLFLTALDPCVFDNTARIV